MTASTGRRRRRADAERSIASIVDAAVDAFSRRPDVSMSEVATAAGVGRVTLYAHFPSREALLEAAIERALAQAAASLDGADLGAGSAEEALERLVHTSWTALHRYGGLLTAAAEIAPSRLREHHGDVLDRMSRLIARGQAEGVFRTDLPSDWLVTVCYSLFHAAAEEVAMGKLAAGSAAGVLTATIAGALRPPS